MSTEGSRHEALRPENVRPQEILVATGNPHKVEEITAVLSPLGIRCVGLGSLGFAIPEPVESGRTFRDNARIKAIAYATAARRWALADDSGLVVDALGGEPGVDSAIWAGAEGTRSQRDARNNARLSAEIKSVPEASRTARFVCCMCLANPSGEVVQECCGMFEGRIIDEPRGNNGFGYDPYLYLPALGRTSAQLSSGEKNRLSHRGAASRALADWLRGLSQYAD